MEQLFLIVSTGRYVFEAVEINCFKRVRVKRGRAWRCGTRRDGRGNEGAVWAGRGRARRRGPPYIRTYKCRRWGSQPHRAGRCGLPCICRKRGGRPGQREIMGEIRDG